MLQALHRVTTSGTGLTTTVKDFDRVEPALSYIVDFLTRNAALADEAANMALIVRYLAQDKTTVCERQLFTNAVTLTNLQTCP